MDLRVTLFKHGRAAFLDLLHEHNIEYEEESVEAGAIRASGELIWLGGVAISALSSVFIAWLGGRAKRKIMLQTGARTVQIEGGYSLHDVKQIIEAANSEGNPLRAIVIQAEKDDEKLLETSKDSADR